MLNIPLMENNIIKEDIEALIQFLQESDIFTQNKNVRKFEEAWSDWLGVKHSVFVNSGSSANFMTMAGIAELYGTGEIIVPTITWSSDISSVITTGHTPVFIDTDFKNMAMVEEDILSHITEKTKAVFLSHILGFNGLTDPLINELKRRNILLIEDVCESHGVTHKGEKAGSIGFASNFSFYYAHHMSTIEGGMICTNDDRFYQFMRMYRSHGLLRESTDNEYKEAVMNQHPDLNPEFIFTVPGYNMRSTELNAIIGLNQLKRLDHNITIRQNNFEYFLEKLDHNKFYTDFILEGGSNYAFVLLLKEKNDVLFQRLVQKLRDEKVEFRRGTAGGGNQTRQPFVSKRYPNIVPENYSNSEHIHFYGMYTGNFPDLSKERIQQLTQLLNEV